MSRRYAAVAFDLDGTLLDSIDLIVAAYQAATEAHLGYRVARERMVPTIGRSLLEVLDELSGGDGARLLPTYHRYIEQNHDRMVRLYPGVLEVLADLRARGYPLAIVTAKRRSVADLAFRLTGIDRLVDHVLCLEDAPRPKPAPDPLLAASRLLARPARHCVYVGDSQHDMAAAAAAGMAGAAALWGPTDAATLQAAGATHLLHQPADVLTLLPGR